MQSQRFFDVCGGLFFSYKHKAQEFVDTERLGETLLLMEGPRLVRVELKMASTPREQYITPIGVSGPSQPGL